MSAAVGYEDIRGFKVATGRGDRQVTFHLQQHEELVVLGVEHHRAAAHDWLSDVGEVLWPEQGLRCAMLPLKTALSGRRQVLLPVSFGPMNTR